MGYLPENARVCLEAPKFGFQRRKATPLLRVPPFVEAHPKTMSASKMEIGGLQKGIGDLQTSGVEKLTRSSLKGCLNRALFSGVAPANQTRKRAEYGFGEHGFKHWAQWVFRGSLSSGERTQWVPLSLLFVCQNELTEFFAELTEFAPELSEDQWVLFSETVLSKQYSARFLQTKERATTKSSWISPIFVNSGVFPQENKHDSHFVPERPCEKFMNWPFFGLVCRGRSWFLLM